MSGWGIFGWLSDKIQGIKTPRWLKEMFDNIQSILVSVLYQVGVSAINGLKNKIIMVSSENISNDEKFNKVFDYAKKELNLGHLKDNVLDLLIQALVSYLKGLGQI